MTITQIIAAIFTTARGFGNTDRSTLVTYYTNNIATLVDTVATYDELVQAYTDVFKASIYAPIEKGDPVTWQFFLDAAEQVCNQTKEDSNPAVGGFTVLKMQLTQAAAADPTANVLQSTLPDQTLTLARTAQGVYTIRATDSFGTGRDKIFFQISNMVTGADGVSARLAWLDSGTLELTTSIDAVATDTLLDETDILIEVYPTV